MRELAAQFVALAEKWADVIPLIVGHRLLGSSLTLTGNSAARSIVSPSDFRFTSELGH
jgi:hypothetical protein